MEGIHIVQSGLEVTSGAGKYYLSKLSKTESRFFLLRTLFYQTPGAESGVPMEVMLPPP